MKRGLARIASACGLLFLVACGGGEGSKQTGGCVNSCTQAGAAQCLGAQVQTCTADTSGCLSLSAAA